MITSSADSASPSAATASPVILPSGSMTQTARGAGSALTSSAIEPEGVAPSVASA